jgi:hypothetical protein
MMILDLPLLFGIKSKITTDVTNTELLLSFAALEAAATGRPARSRHAALRAR